MESSEDDAGTATSASRRASAREKDVQQAEDVDATSCYQQGSSEPRASCQTPAMSEDNFDGDSVPSPSQDVNTSTEAILDMIDEIVDGPGAPKRLPPLTVEVVTAVIDESASTSSSHSQHELDVTEPDCKNSQPQPQSSTSTTSAKSENSDYAEIFDTPPVCITDVGTMVDTDNTDNNDLQASSSVPECNESDLPEQPQVQAVSNPDPETSAACLVLTIPSIVEAQTVKEPATASECDNLERTVKCVTSSDSHDNVVVESAESTSSDSSVSEFKVTPVEVLTRSPLRRRLVRPAPSDRRPDSTVSSTVDSQTINDHTSHPGQSNGAGITKDVSSSSDAVPTVHANIKPEEIRNVSEISFCKAETSMSPPKKIKLIRQKVTPVMVKKDYVLEQESLSSERDPCQSTSSENLLMTPEPCAHTSNAISTTKLQASEVESISCNDSASDKSSIQGTEPIRESLKETHKANETISITNPSSDDEKTNITGDQILVPPIKQTVSTLNLQETHIVENEVGKNNAKCNDNDHHSVPDEKKEDVLVDSNVCISNSPKLSENVINNEIQGISSAITREDEKIFPASDVDNDAMSSSLTSSSEQETIETTANNQEKKVPPIKLNLSVSNLGDPCVSKINIEKPSSNVVQEESECIKQVPKLTIKLNAKQTEEMKSPVPKVTIKPIKPPSEESTDIKSDNSQSIPTVTKINIKPILKPPEIINDTSLKSHMYVETDAKMVSKEQIPSITKLNIKPIPKPPEKINEIHRKSSSSEISESEYSENDESTSTSDQASASDQGPPDIVPKVTIKLGKPGTQSEGKFYTEQNIPKLTIKGLQQCDKDDQEPGSMLKLVISQSDDKQLEKIPKMTIKNVLKADGQPLSPKLTIKTIKASDNVNKEIEIPKGKMAESFSSSTEVKENTHVPKITIKPVTKLDTDSGTKTPKKSTAQCDSPDYIPIVTKLNIKPILKPTDEGETSESLEDKVPVVSKLNIKPVIKPKVNEVDSNVEDVPKIVKLNIKPLNSPEEITSGEKDCDVSNSDIDENSIPVITKLNIKPIVKPTEEEDTLKYSENQSSEAGNSSDDNIDYIPFVTKLNIKPIIKPNDVEVAQRPIISNDENIPVITKLNIKPLIKPDECASPSSPKKENLKNPDLRNCAIPVVTKLNIKPVVKPEIEQQKTKIVLEEKSSKHPPLLMKINMRAVADTSNSESLLHNESKCNNVSESLSPISKLNIKHVNHTDSGNLPHWSQMDDKKVNCEADKSIVVKHTSDASTENIDLQNSNLTEGKSDMGFTKKAKNSNVNIENSLPADELSHHSSDSKETVSETKNVLSPRIKSEKIGVVQICEANESIQSSKHDNKGDSTNLVSTGKQKTSVQNCTLLKKLLESTKDGLDKRLEPPSVSVINCTASDKTDHSIIIQKNIKSEQESKDIIIDKVNCEISLKNEHKSSPVTKNDINCSLESPIHHLNRDLHSGVNENLTKPLEISISEKISNQSSGQDSPRIILKINKTDHGSSAKIITEETKRPDTLQQNHPENTQELINDKQNQKRQMMNSRRKQTADAATSMPTGKRLRSSRIVENTEKSPVVKRNVGKRPQTLEIASPQNKESDLSVLETKRLKLGQLLSASKSLTITPVVSKITQLSPTKPALETKQGVKAVNHSILNNENCSKNGNSKLHKILSNLQAKQMQTIPLNDTNCLEKIQSLTSEVESNTSTGSDTVEVVENCHPEVQEMIINENSDFRDFSTGPDEVSQDPLEVDSSKIVSDCTDDSISIPKIVELTPQPKKRGRPRKLPVSEGAKPITLPVPALEERPQRSLRLMSGASRDRPAILTKPRGRGRGRGGRRSAPSPPPELEPEPELVLLDDTPGTIDPTSSRIKLPRMTEALDKMPGACSTPLTSRRRRSSAVEMKLFDSPDSKVVLESLKSDEEMKSPEATVRGRGGRGSRGARGSGAGRGRTPRARGRGRGGGRGAMYMKETMGIYGRVCGPATTTVQLFEEETCMMDDNATPAKPSHLLDEDSQSSVKSSTNESNKMKKSKFADLFDSNKVWTAADVKEYTWPPPERPDVEHQIMMIQEQVAMFLSVKSFKRRYPELKRRTIGGEERDYVLSKGLVTEALCDLGITAVDASEVLDIMLSDYPHKYEEYRSHQRERQRAEPEEVPEIKTEDKGSRVEIKMEIKSIDQKPEPPKIDPEKTRQDLAAAAIASASEWNSLVNSLRRPACADLQSLTIQRRRAGGRRDAGPGARPPLPLHVRPPAGFYPHALLPGQYQHYYRHYTPEQLRCFPLNTTLEAPRVAVAAAGGSSPAHSSSDSEGEWGALRGSSSDDSASHHHAAKRKKLTKVKRSSQAEATPGTSRDRDRDRERDKEDSRDGEVDTCRVCKLRLEANRKYTHERFLVCSNCNAKLHPGCVELSADTVRKCREYAWQCGACKACGVCGAAAARDKMLFCDLCDRGFHLHCVALAAVPTGRWHCVECAVCKSCGAREPSGGATGGATGGSTAGATGGASDAEWHHQTRRGPGGHKIYSHSLCTPCARAYRIGRYCPLCERSFIGPKGTMQLVICKLCDRQHHQECVRQTVSKLKVLDYTCAECRRGGITSRAAAVRLAPRTIATLFMAKRRFNKYAHRQYMQSRLRDAPAPEPGSGVEPEPEPAPEPGPGPEGERDGDGDLGRRLSA